MRSLLASVSAASLSALLALVALALPARALPVPAPTASQDAPAAADALEARRSDIAARVLRQRTELARWAFDRKLYREAGKLAQEVLRAEPTHALLDLAKQLESIEPERYRNEYRAAFRDHGLAFQKERRTKLVPLASELSKLGAEADKAGRSELAERCYVDAYRIDADDTLAAKGLKAKDYELVFNYGPLPAQDKQASREALKALGGGFLARNDLAKELETWPDAWGLSTRHYRFVTNAQHALVFRFAQACEDLHAAWEQLLDGSKLKVRKLKEPLVVYFFDSTVAYQAILRARGIEPPSHEEALGFYWGETKDGYFFYEPAFYGDDTTLLFETFYHEGTHQLCDLRLKAARGGDDARFPLGWLVEGLATYMEGLEVDVRDGKRSFRLGAAIDDDLEGGLDGVKAGELQSFEAFLHCDGDAFSANDLGYQHGALLAHFLLHADKGKYRAAFFQLVEGAYEKGGLGKSAFELFKWDAAQMQREFDAYAAGLRAALPARAYPKRDAHAPADEGK